jgi:5'-3' exonuclease
MYAFSAWHALKGKVEWPLTYQVPRMIRPLIEESGGAWAICWNGEDQWKRERWPAYRDRPEIWEEARREDFETLLRALTALGALQYRSPRLEADEAIAALVHRLADDADVVIRSDDKDFMQLLSSRVRMAGRRRGEVRHTDVESILGVTPEYAADWQALTGDAVDGIPRIVPPAKAVRLIGRLGHVRDWLDGELPPDEPLAKTLEAGRAQVRLNLELVDLSRAAVEAAGAPGEPLLVGWGDLDVARAIGEQTGVSWLVADDLEAAWAPLRAGGGRARERLGI